MKKHIPVKSTTQRWDVPWISPNIKRMIRKKQRLYNRARKSNLHQDWSAFKQWRNVTSRALRSSHDNYVLGLLDTSSSSSENPSIGKRFWSYIKSRKSDPTGITTLKEGNKETSDGPEQAEILNRQYQSVFTKEDLSSMPVLGPSPFNSMPDIDFSTDGIEKLLTNLKSNKASGPDAIPARILKEAASEIAPSLRIIFHQSWVTGVVPSDWRKANVCAVFKKGDRTDAANYRPVSLTSIPCKIMEHIVLSNIMSHCDKHSILKHFQHGFRGRHSCETQLIITLDDLHKSLDNNLQSDVLILDFSKAFDCVAHRRLISKLNYYGIKEETNNWIKNWLSDRTQTVILNGHKSSVAPVTSGVPQGSVLGPMLFLLFINDISDGVKSPIRLFADDCVLYLAIKKTADALQLQKDLSSLESWAQKWQMNFNVKKCYKLMVTRKKQPRPSDYTMQGKTLADVTHNPYLGIEFQKDLKWDLHINNIVCKANKILGFLRRNLSHCPTNVKAQAYFTLVRPHLEYASCAWDPHLQQDISKLEMVQRQALRFVCGEYARTPGIVTSLYQRLGWPTLQQRREFQRLSMFYKIMNKMVAVPIPPSLCPPARTGRRQQQFIQLPARTDTYKESFYPRTLTAWQNLPLSTRQSKTLDVFKKEISPTVLKSN